MWGIDHVGFPVWTFCRANIEVEARERPGDMGKGKKLLDKILRGQSDTNIRFDDLRSLLIDLGFAERMRGDHHIFTRDGVPEILNLQPKGNKAKAYQVKQVRAAIVSHSLIAERKTEAGFKTGKEKKDGE